MEINEYLVRVSGKVALEPKEFELGSDVELTLKGTIIEIKHQDTQEGTMDKTYIIKPVDAKLK